MRRTVLIILGVAGGLVALVLIAVAIAIATVDVNTFAEPLAARVRAATGRNFTIGGPIGLRLSLEPTLRIDNVALGNVPWGRTPAMLRAARVEAQVALLPLLHRRFEIVRVTLVDPVISLETDRQGNGNWIFGEPASKPAAAPPPGPEATLAAGPAFGVGEVEVRNGRIRYTDGVTGDVKDIAVESLTVQSRDAAGPIVAEFRGNVDGVPIALKGNFGSRQALLASQWPYPVDIAGTVAGRSATVKGKVTPAPGSTRVEELQLAFGDLALNGTLVVDRSGPHPRYVIDMHLPRLAPEALALPAAASGGGSPPGKAAPPAPSHYVVPDQPLPLASLRAADAEGTIAIDTIALPHAQTIDHARLRFGLHNGRLDIVELAGKGFGGSVLARGVLQALDDPARGASVDVHAEGRDLELGPILALQGAPREVSGGRTRFTFDGKASGPSLHDWAATLDGNVLLLVGPAHLKNPPGSSTAVLDRVSGAVNPFRDKKGGTDLKCAVVRLPVHNGVARTDHSIALETEEIGVSATGTLDLRNETLDLSLKPQVRSGIPLDVAGFADVVRVSGSFRDPQVGIDPAKSAAAIARIGAAVGTGGWSLLGETLLNNSAAADSPCAIALGAKPAAPPPSASSAQAVPHAADLGKALGKLFGR
jgi:uncharacterized protein involved in outer membrane biogenesis